VRRVAAEAGVGRPTAHILLVQGHLVAEVFCVDSPRRRLRNTIRRACARSARCCATIALWVADEPESRVGDQRLVSARTDVDVLRSASAATFGTGWPPRSGRTPIPTSSTRWRCSIRVALVPRGNGFTHRMRISLRAGEVGEADPG